MMVQGRPDDLQTEVTVVGCLLQLQWAEAMIRSTLLAVSITKWQSQADVNDAIKMI